LCGAPAVTGTENGGLQSARNQMHERELIEAAQNDPRHFAELYEHNFDKIYAFIISRVRNRNHAEDLTSEVFHRALTNLKQFEWRGAPFSSWLFRIASNLIADHSARQSRELDWPESERANFESNVEFEQRTTLSKLIAGLPLNQRRVLEMRFSQELSIREIAEQLQRTENSVKQLQFRALRNLRAKMSDKNE
jgi:RNA polymerase sigma-70 factor, ECF subfamily